MTDIVVSGVGLATALGLSVADNIDALRTARSGILPSPVILKTSHFVPVGEILLNNKQLHEVAKVSCKEHLSRTALLGIIAVKEALTDAVVDFSKRVALVSASSVGGMDLTEHFYQSFLQDASSGRLRDVRMHDCAAITRSIGQHCRINGYSTTVSTACSSAANAIIFGAKLLKHDMVDYVVVGGCDALTAFTLNGFQSLRIIDPLACKPFDQDRNGLNLGEGAGFMILQKRSSAVNEYCRLGGYANHNDAHHQTASSIAGDGAYLSMSGAIKMAGITPNEVTYINAHGTGTINNDLSECVAMQRVFGDQMPMFSSTKSYMGHTLAAAGGIEAVLSVLAVKFGFIYPNLNFTNPIENLNMYPETRFKINHNNHCVLSNSFGFGGNCTSLLFLK